MHPVLCEILGHMTTHGESLRVVRKNEPTLSGVIVDSVGHSANATHVRVAFGPYADMAPDDRRRIIAALPVALDDLEVYRPVPDMSRFDAPGTDDEDSREFIVWELFDTIRALVRGGVPPMVAAEKLRALVPDSRRGWVDDAHDMYCDWITARAVTLGL